MTRYVLIVAAVIIIVVISSSPGATAQWGGPPHNMTVPTRTPIGYAPEPSPVFISPLSPINTPQPHLVPTATPSPWDVGGIYFDIFRKF